MLQIHRLEAVDLFKKQNIPTKITSIHFANSLITISPKIYTHVLQLTELLILFVHMMKRATLMNILIHQGSRLNTNTSPTKEY